MRKRIGAIWIVAMLVFLTACGQQAEESGKLQTNGKPGQSQQSEQGTAPEKETSEAPQVQKEISVIDVYSEEGTWQDGDGFELSYSYHIPEIASDAPGVTEINEEIQADCVSLMEEAMDSMDSGESPECTSITYEYFQNDSVLSLVIKRLCYYGILEDYAVYNYDVERDAELDDSDMAALSGVSDEALQNAVIRASAQTFDDTYHSMEDWSNDMVPGLYASTRAETLGEEYLSGDPMIYQGKQGEPHAIFPVWTFADPGMAYFDRPLELSAGRTETLEEELFTVSWDNTGVTIRFHGDRDCREFWEEQFDCGWNLEYDRDLPVRGLYSNYTKAALQWVDIADRPILFLLTDKGLVEYVDLVPCIKGGYLCGGGPLVRVENATDFTEEEKGGGTFQLCAVCEDGSTVDLVEELAREQIIPYALCEIWDATVTHQVDGGGSYENFYELSLEPNGQMRLQSSVFDVGINLFYSGYMTLLGVTEDGMVYYYEYYDAESDAYDIPYRGVSAFRKGYDQDTWEDLLDVRTLGVGINGLFDAEPGTVTTLSLAWG